MSEIKQYEQQLLLQRNYQERKEVVENLENNCDSHSPLKEKNSILYGNNILPPINEAVAINEETIDGKLNLSKEEVKETKFFEEENNTEITNLKDKKEDDTNRIDDKNTFINAENEENRKDTEHGVVKPEGCHFCQSCFIY